MARIETLAEGITLYPGDCLDVLASLPDNSVDSCVTDPPYHLTSEVATKRSAFPGRYAGTKGAAVGFMGKSWDGGDIAFRPEIWAQVLRVLKPGAHLLSFGGTRTYHRMACAIEDAGFEIRDSIQWLYGSGFPKSLDVSKAIDKAAGAERRIIGSKIGQPGYSLNQCGDPGGVAMQGNVDGSLRNPDAECAITAPATDDAREWNGWGTALKPAMELICLARKPLSESTVAANVLKWGTGALNIDACRVAAGGHAHDAGRDSREDSTPYIFPSPTDDQTSRSSRTLFPVSSASQHPQRSDLLSNVELSDRENSQSQDFPADCRPSDDSCDALIREGEADGQASAGRPGDVDKSRDPQSARERSPDCLSMPSNDDTTRHIQQQGNGRDSEPSANRRYTDNGSTNFAATPGPRGGSPAGRWPANVIHDGSDEVVGAFPDNLTSGTGSVKRATSDGHQGTVYGKENRPVGTPNIEYSDAGSAARFFYQAKNDVRCPLCDANIAESPSRTESIQTGDSVRSDVVDSLPHGSEARDHPSSAHAINAERHSPQCHPPNADIAQESAPIWDERKIAQNVAAAAGLCGSCVTVIAQEIAEVRRSGSADQFRSRCSIEGFRGIILSHSLASYVAHRESTDTILTTTSLRELFGCVFHAIAENINSARVGSAANTKPAPKRLWYSSKADSDDRLGSKHPTVKPVDLIQYLVRLVTPPRGLVLDPFAGTGTAGEACIREKLRCILIEREAEYCDDIRRRMKLAMAGPDERGRESAKARNPNPNLGPLFQGYDAQKDLAGSMTDGFAAIRERKAAGGQGWGE